MSHSIRRARGEDHARITEIRNAASENKLGEASRPLVDRDYPWFRDSPGVWVWEEDGEILGFSAADTRDGSIWALFVAPGHERRGIGRALFEKALGVLRQYGHCTAWLTTEPGSRAERFYRAAGWKVIGTSQKGELIFHSRISRNKSALNEHLG
jgi:GNAT superfamily N-acetyltransferase